MLERLASCWCDRIVSVNEFHRRWALELGICGPRKIVAIPNGIARPSPKSPMSTAGLRLGQGMRSADLIIFNMGRLAPEKGVEYLIEAASLLQRTGQSFRVVLAGDGPLRAGLERLAEDLDVRRKVDFLGHREDIPDLLAACDLVVLPSLREGLSIALLEAMAAGKPIVTTQIGSNRAVASQAEMALLVPPGDPQALCDAILRCWGDAALRARLGTNARLLFESRYTEDRMLGSYRQLYLDLLKVMCSRLLPMVGPKRRVGLAGSPNVPARINQTDSL